VEIVEDPGDEIAPEFVRYEHAKTNNGHRTLKDSWRGGDGGGNNNEPPTTGGNVNPDDEIPDDPTVQNQFRDSVRQLREDNNLTSNRQMERNVADATYNINGQTGELPAISGPPTREPPGFTQGPEPGNNHFEPIATGNNPRTNDSEYKILEKIADDHWGDDPDVRAQVTGEIRLYTELPPCSSCSNVIGQFQKAFPNIKIFVGWG
jgi:hypothetical protein